MRSKDKKKAVPYRNWTERELKDTIIIHLNRIDTNPLFKRMWKDLVNEAFESKDWKVISDYNGCTMLQDFFHPCPACFVHDYMWVTGHGGRMSDRIFKACMKAEGMSNYSSNVRWFGVRLGWIFGYYWKYKLKGQLKKPTDAMKEINKFIRL